MWASLRSGDWITEQRLKVYPLILLAFSALTVAAMIGATHDRLGPDGQPLGTDFSQVWVAGLETLRGHPEAPFDIARHIGAQHAEFGADSAVYGWHYPPYFLAPAALLAHLPYLQALLVWQLATLLLYLVVIDAVTRGGGFDRTRVLTLALAFPAVLVNLGHGQNGFLTAALLGGGFFILERRPLLAGALLALLAYKPQFALVLPVALLAGRHWRALAAAAATLAVMTVASLAAFGLESWRAFIAGLAFTRTVVVEQGAAGFEKIQSVFAGVRLMGGDVSTAYAVQAIVTLGALAALVWLWRSNTDARLKIAATLTATLLTTPYCLDYDMLALAPAIALLVAHGRQCGFEAFEKTVLVLAFVAPLLARPVATFLPLPLGAATILLLFVSTLRRASRRDCAAPALP